MINRNLLEYVMNGEPKERRYLFRNDPLHFAVYYFPQYFHHPIAPFHYDFYEDIKKLLSGEIDELMWVAFRESAKSSLKKIAGVIWAICYEKKKYINWDSYVKPNAEAALFDIVLQLQTNKRLIQDFGELYYREREKDSRREAQRKRVASFITENGIKVEAFSTQESTRGRVFGDIRPDWYIFDDFETVKTRDSYPVIGKIKDHIKEAKAGLGPGGSVSYLCNYITEDGVVDFLLNGDEDTPGLLQVQEETGHAIVRNIPVEDKKGITWPGKYVKTDKEAAEHNKFISDPERYKVSLESKLRSLGKATYATDMMNDPTKAGDYYFERERMEELKENTRAPKQVIGGLKIWNKYNPKHRYGLGADTSFGIGRDANALCVIDFSRRPAQVVATFKDNEMKQDIFAWEVQNAGTMFGNCIVLPEINMGYGTVAQLVKDPENGGCGYGNVYKREVKTRGKVMNEFGFWMSAATKPDILSQFKTAVEDGELEILDKDLFEECLRYRNRDVYVMKPEEGMTRHFDLLISAALAWEANKWAKLPKKDTGRYMSSQKKGEYQL